MSSTRGVAGRPTIHRSQATVHMPTLTAASDAAGIPRAKDPEITTAPPTTSATVRIMPAPRSGSQPA